MPELPEVETVVLTLKRMILNERIVDVIINWDNIIDKISINEFKKDLVDQKFVDIKRYGKIICFELDDYFMLSHLRMEGKYFVDEKLTIDKHSHVIFVLASGKYLRYHDVRKFGKISLVKKDELLKHPYLVELGKEPFDMSAQELYEKLQKKKIEIKAALLDQHIIAGLGNIYVDEVLFRCKINPFTKANTISLTQCQKIIDNSIIVLNKAIALGGTTIRSYTSSLGVHGKFQNELLVHTKAGTLCPICNDKIIKTTVKGRGTYLCPTCQKL